ncbi:MAG: SDR family oxidoreductase [Tepidiformaceae bacterium]
MILVVGGTGTLGKRLTELLAGDGHAVRVLSRRPAAAGPASTKVEYVGGDVRDRAAVSRAMEGVTTVVSAMHGFLGTGHAGPRGIDAEGNAILVEAAVAAGVQHFVLVSVQGASATNDLELSRMKYVAEQNLQASALSWTVVRPTAFMETWAQIVGEPLVRKGKALIFGRGVNPINFVSATDVARLIELAIGDPAMRGEVIEFGGPENLTFVQLATIVANVTGKETSMRHIPLPVMRAAALILRPIKPAIARQIRAGVVMDTLPLAFDARPSRLRFPRIPETSFEDVVRREFAPSPARPPFGARAGI